MAIETRAGIGLKPRRIAVERGEYKRVKVRGAAPAPWPAGCFSPRPDLTLLRLFIFGASGFRVGGSVSLPGQVHP